MIERRVRRRTEAYKAVREKALVSQIRVARETGKLLKMFVPKEAVIDMIGEIPADGKDLKLTEEKWKQALAFACWPPCTIIIFY